MSTETAIEPGDRVRHVSMGEGLVTRVFDERVEWLPTGSTMWISKAKHLRLVAKASYTNVPEPPSEHPAVTELRKACQSYCAYPLEWYTAPNRSGPAPRLARAVLAVIDLIPPEDERAVRRCRAKHPTNETVVPCTLDRGHLGDHFSTTGCAGSEIAWPSAELQAEVTRLTERAERAERERDRWRYGLLRRDDDDVAARAEAAEAASSRLVEAMEKLADEFDAYRSDVVFARRYRVASERIRAAVKAATEAGAQ